MKHSVHPPDLLYDGFDVYAESKDVAGVEKLLLSGIGTIVQSNILQ